MDKIEVKRKLKEFSELVDIYYHPNKMILYGSYARGNWNENSDIDVAVIVDRIEGNYLEQLTNLFKLRRKIDLRIEPVLIVEGNDPSGFLESITDYGELIK